MVEREDRDFWYKLRNLQRRLVMKELEKETLEVERRIGEEKKKAEESKERLKIYRTRRKLIKLFFIILLVVLAIIFYYLFKHPEKMSELLP